MAKKIHIQTRINGKETEFLCEPRQSLLEVLRDELRLTGSKEGCNNGNCGACNVILDGRLVNSCLVLGAEVQGDRSRPSRGSPLQGLASLAAEIPGGGRLAVRHLHAGIHRGGQGPAGAEAEADRASDAALAGGQPVPLHRLRQDRPGGARRCRECGAKALTPAKATGRNSSPLAPVLRGEGSGVRGLGRGSLVPLTPNPSPPKRGRGEMVSYRSPKKPRQGIMSQPLNFRSSAPGPSATTAWTRSPAGRSTAPTCRWPACCMVASCAARMPHARIRRIDVAQGPRPARRRGRRHRRRLPRSRRPDRRAGRRRDQPAHLSANCLARDKVLYKGQAVAAVAAVSPHVAEEALSSDRRRVRAACRTVTRRVRGDERRRPAPARRSDHRVARQADRQAVQRRQALPVQAGRRRRRPSPRRPSSIEQSFTPPPSTRATSSRTTRRPCGTPTAT